VVLVVLVAHHRRHWLHFHGSRQDMGIVGWFHRKMVILWELYGDFQGFHRDDVFFFYSDFMVILYFLFLDSFSLDIIGM
jgi:hypothetical protein